MYGHIPIVLVGVVGGTILDEKLPSKRSLELSPATDTGIINNIIRKCDSIE